MPESRSDETNIAVLQTEMKNLVEGFRSLGNKVDNLTEKIETNYVKVDDFKPIKEAVENLKMFKAQMIAGGAVLGFLLDYLVRWLTKGN